MAFSINSINIRVNNGLMNRIDIYYSASNDNNNDRMSGNVELTPDEYLNNVSLDRLEPLVRRKVSEFILDGIAPTEETEGSEDIGNTEDTENTDGGVQAQAAGMVQQSAQEISPTEVTDQQQTTQGNARGKTSR